VRMRQSNSIRESGDSSVCRNTVRHVGQCSSLVYDVEEWVTDQLREGPPDQRTAGTASLTKVKRPSEMRRGNEGRCRIDDAAVAGLTVCERFLGLLARGDVLHMGNEVGWGRPPEGGAPATR